MFSLCDLCLLLINKCTTITICLSFFSFFKLAIVVNLSFMAYKSVYYINKVKDWYHGWCNQGYFLWLAIRYRPGSYYDAFWKHQDQNGIQTLRIYRLCTGHPKDTCRRRIFWYLQGYACKLTRCGTTSGPTVWNCWNFEEIHQKNIWTW